MSELFNILEKVCHKPIKQQLELDAVIERLEEDIDFMREVETLHYHADDKEQLANDIEALIYKVLELTGSPRIKIVGRN